MLVVSVVFGTAFALSINVDNVAVNAFCVSCDMAPLLSDAAARLTVISRTLFCVSSFNSVDAAMVPTNCACISTESTSVAIVSDASSAISTSLVATLFLTSSSTDPLSIALLIIFAAARTS